MGVFSLESSLFGYIARSDSPGFATELDFIWKVFLTYRITTPYAAARFSCSDNDIRIQFLYSDDLGGPSDHVRKAVSRGLVAV